MKWMVRRTLAAFLLFSALACASSMRNRMLRWTDPYLDVPTRMAVQSAALGFRTAIRSEGVEVLCVGDVLPRLSRRTGDEAELAARRAWEGRVVDMVRDLYPVVVPADYCHRTPDSRIVLTGSEDPAVEFQATVTDEYGGWVQAHVSIHSRSPMVNRRQASDLTGSFTLRMNLEGSVWRVVESWCVAYAACDTFSDDSVIRRMETDVLEPMHSRGG